MQRVEDNRVRPREKCIRGRRHKWRLRFQQLQQSQSRRRSLPQCIKGSTQSLHWHRWDSRRIGWRAVISNHLLNRLKDAHMQLCRLLSHQTEATGQTRRVIGNKGLLIMLSRQLPTSLPSRRWCRPQQELPATPTRSRILNSMWVWLRWYAIISQLSKLLHAINALKQSQKWMTSSKQSRSKSRGSKIWSVYLKTSKMLS